MSRRYSAEDLLVMYKQGAHDHVGSAEINQTKLDDDAVEVVGTYVSGLPTYSPAMIDTADRNLTALVSRYVPEGADRQAALNCIVVLSEAAQSHRQLLDTLAASDQNNAMGIIAEHHLRENRASALGAIVMSASSGETLRERVAAEIDEWGLLGEADELADTVLTIVGDALKVG